MEDIRIECPECGYCNPRLKKDGIYYCQIIGKGPYYCPDCGEIMKIFFIREVDKFNEHFITGRN